MQNAQSAYQEKMARREASLARKVERRTEWADKAEARSLEAYNASNQAVAGIEFGQPILMGHHSQRRHENAIKRAQKKMSKASAEHRLAAHHEYKAENAQRALDKRSTPDFCVRRIKEATADISRLERNKGMYASDMTHWQTCMDTAAAKRDYWKGQLALLGWADERPQNIPANPTACKHKDFGWFDVARVNAKTVTVKNWLGVATMTYKLPLEEITEWKPDLGQSQE